MARTNQKLINYHSPSASTTNAFNPANVEYGEIAVRHIPSEPRLYVKTGEDTYATFVDSAQTIVMIDDRNQNTITDLQYVSGCLISVSGAFVTLSGDFETVSAQVETNKSDISRLSTDLGTYNSNLTYFSGYVLENYSAWTETKEYIDDKNTDLTKDINYVSGQVSAFSSTVVTQYATKEEVKTASGNAISSAITSAKSYVDSVSGYIVTFFSGNYATSADTHEAIQSVKTSIDNVETGLTQLSGSVITFSASVVDMESGLIGRIESALTVVYKFKGTVTNYSDLAAIQDPQNGDVYNVVNAQGIIGESGYTPPGTNYAWVAPNGDDPEAEGYVPGHWDELGGQVDLSDYVTQSELSSATATTDNVQKAVDYVSGQVSAFSSTVVTQYATKEEVKTASGNAISSAKSYVDSVSGYIVTFFSGNYATSANTYLAIDSVNTKIETTNEHLDSLSGSVIELSGSVNSIKATADNALNEFKLETVSNPTTTQSGAKASYVNGGGATLDLSGLVIDCGDF